MQPASIEALIALWPDMRVLADDCGVSYETVAAWKRRNSIHIRHWDAIRTSARARGIPSDALLAAALAHIAASARARGIPGIKRQPLLDTAARRSAA